MDGYNTGLAVVCASPAMGPIFVTNGFKAGVAVVIDGLSRVPRVVEASIAIRRKANGMGPLVVLRPFTPPVELLADKYATGFGVIF